MADHQKVVYDLSNGAIFNDLEQLLTQSLFDADISQTVKDTAILTTEGE